MSAHNSRHDLWLNDPLQKQSTTNGGLLEPGDEWGATLTFDIGASPETRKIPPPTNTGQRIQLVAIADGGSTTAVTVSNGSAVNQAGNTTMTFQDAGDHVILESIPITGGLRWQIVFNSTVTLS